MDAEFISMGLFRGAFELGGGMRVWVFTTKRVSLLFLDIVVFVVADCCVKESMGLARSKVSGLLLGGKLVLEFIV